MAADSSGLDRVCGLLWQPLPTGRFRCWSSTNVLCKLGEEGLYPEDVAYSTVVSKVDFNLQALVELVGLTV